MKNKDLTYNKTKAVPAPETDIGIDNTDSFLYNIADTATSSQTDLNKLNSFLNVSQRREELYKIIDMMAYDSTVAAILETYSEDATEYNDDGRIVSVTSGDAKISRYIEYLLDSLQVDKNIYMWVNSLCKYGDLYLELYKESEYKDALDLNPTKNKKKQPLNEDIIVNAYGSNDRYVDFIEAVTNPAEMFELTQFGKTYAYIKAPILQLKETGDILNQSTNYTYKYVKKDVHIYPPSKFVHGALQDSTNRYSEEITLFQDNLDDKTGVTYKVRRGQSLLYNSFKIWRELSLLENSILLNRVTKSSIVRLINIEIGDMPKEQVGPYLQKMKSMLEQNMAATVGQGIQEYTNPGPIENNIYVPSKDGQGTVTTSQIGGDVNISNLPDVEYYQNKFFGSFRIPKQYFGITDDAAGFSGGESLAIISSRYAKMVKRIQSTIIQVLTDAINLILIDRGLDGHIGKFDLKMVTPTTKEEIERRDAESNKIRIITDIMNELGIIKEDGPRLRILKLLMSDVIKNNEVVAILDEVIEKYEKEEEVSSNNLKNDSEASGEQGFNDFSEDRGIFNIDSSLNLDDVDDSLEIETDETIGTLPTPAELDIGDLADNETEI